MLEHKLNKIKNMGLHFDYTGIANYHELHSDAIEHQKSEYIVMMTMLVRTPLTEKNFDKFATRFFTALTVIGDERSKITASDLRRRIGLWTNGGNSTDKEFKEWVIGDLTRNAQRRARAGQVC